jgi:beta-lactamase regulating signal transducer with metallopeptidase domain
MLGEIFYWTLNLSILGSGAGLILLLLGRIRRIPRFGIYLLWLLPLIRFLVPFGIANRYSLLNLLSQFTTKTIVIRSEFPALSLSNSVMAADHYFPITYKTEVLERIFADCGTVWAIVAGCGVLCSLTLYFFTKSAIGNAALVEDDFYRSEKIASPAVYGIFRPKIVFPMNSASENRENREFILMHERIHIRRRDNLWRAVAIAVACVHWFNPLVWIFLKHFFIDMELACDAGVLKTLNREEQKQYARTLLSVGVPGKTYYASAFGGVKTRLRIENILSYQKLTIASGLCFAALLTIVAVTVITNATA